MFYSDGTITLTAGSKNVIGTGTGWTLTGVEGGILYVGSESYPIESVTDDSTLVLFAEALVSRVSVPYKVWLVTADQTTLKKLNELQSKQLARSVLVRLRPDARGSLAGRSVYDDREEGFIYGINDNPPFYEFYEKASDVSGDWAGPFQWYGPEGGTGAPGVGDAYDLIIDDQGFPGSGEVLLEHVFTRTVNFPLNLSISRATAPDANPTASAVYSFTKNEVQFGTLTIATNGSRTFSGAATSFGAGDVLHVLAPNPRDATLKGVSITLAGQRI